MFKEVFCEIYRAKAVTKLKMLPEMTVSK